jgi:hypothetical protein
MRRFALLGLVLLLPGCTGFADFMGDTMTYGTNPNAPVGDSENMRRARGLDAEVEPLMPEPGNIWPGPVAPMPTLQDLEKSGFQPSPTGQPYTPDHRQPTPRGSSTPPGNVQPGLPPELQPRPPSVSNSPPARSQTGREVKTPSGPGVTSGGTSGYQTLTTPQGQSVVVPNGNGTSTVIHPDGTVETIPTPR